MIGDRRTWRPLAIDFPPVVQDKPDFSGRWICVSADPPGPDVPRAMTVTQQLVATNVRGEAMTPFFKDITIERETAAGTRSETVRLGVIGGTVGGIVGSIPSGGQPELAQSSQCRVGWYDAGLRAGVLHGGNLPDRRVVRTARNLVARRRRPAPRRGREQELHRSGPIDHARLPQALTARAQRPNISRRARVLPRALTANDARDHAAIERERLAPRIPAVQAERFRGQ